MEVVEATKLPAYQPRRAAPGEDAPPERVYVSYAVVESHRDHLGRPRQRMILELGEHPDLQAKLAGARERVKELSERTSARASDERGAGLNRRALERAEQELVRLEEIERSLARPARGAPGEGGSEGITPPQPPRPRRGRRGRPSSVVEGAPSGLENQ